MTKLQYNPNAPTGTASGSTLEPQCDVNGNQRVLVAGPSLSTDGQSAGTIGWVQSNENSGTGRLPTSAPHGFNGTSWDRWRNNTDLTLLASAARTVTLQSSDQTNYNGRGLHVVLDVTSAGTGSITLTIQAKDVLSGKYYTLLAGAAVTTNSTNVYKVYPGITAAANVSASDLLTRTWRIEVVHNNANSITYSCGASIIL